MRNKKLHIVLIAAWFYPENKVAALRMNAFAKYLDKEKFHVTVISLNHENESKENREFTDVKVYREPYNKFLRIRRQKASDGKFRHKLISLNNKIVSKLIIEDYPGWSNNVFRKLEVIQQSEPIDLVISSYAPVDSHVAADKFKSHHPKVKWIADMRDEMSLNPFLDKKKKLKLEKLEKQFATKIDGLTSVSEPIVDGFMGIMGSGKIKYVEIRNGYDHDKEPLNNFNEEFTMLYAGTFYGKRKPDTFFEALLDLQKSNSIDKGWKFQMLGVHKNFSYPKSLENHLEFIPSVSNEEAVNYMFNADCNVLIHPPMGVKGVYTGKLFEYISAKKPILGLIDTEDVAAKLIAETNSGEVVDFYNVEEIKRAILSIQENWKAKKLPQFDIKKVKMLHRREQVKQLEKLIEQIVSND